MKVQIYDAFTQVLDPTPDERVLLHKVCTLRSKQFIRRKWELHPTEIEVQRKYYRNGKVPTGLLPRIFSAGITLEIEDFREAPEPGTPWPMTLPPLPVTSADYSFQDIAVTTAVQKGRGLLWIPTGGGKTVVFSKIISQLGLKTVIIIPSLELLEQTKNKLAEYFGGDMVTGFGGGLDFDPDASIWVATQQSLYSYLKTNREDFDKLVANIDVMIIDECHHINEQAGKKSKKGKKKANAGVDKKTVANSWWEVAMAIPAYYRYGVSATMNTEDSPNNQFVLESATGKIIYEISTSELIKRDVLVPLEITMVHRDAEPCRLWKSRTVKGELVPGAYDVNIIDAVDRNDLIITLAQYLQATGYKVLVLVDLVGRHGELLAEQIPNSVFLAGKHNRGERNAGIDQFIVDNKILISTLVKEGFDVPAIDAIIIAGGGKSHKMLIQKLGRARRITKGKQKASIFDFFDDDGESTSGPRMCRRHSLERQKIYEQVPEDKVLHLPITTARDIFHAKQ